MGVFTSVPSKSKTCSSSYRGFVPRPSLATASPPEPISTTISHARVNAFVCKNFRQMRRERFNVIELRPAQPQRSRRLLAVQRAIRVKLCAHFSAYVRRAVRLHVAKRNDSYESSVKCVIARVNRRQASRNVMPRERALSTPFGTRLHDAPSLAPPARFTHRWKRTRRSK